jgi:lipoprotein-anchoring transpeptidase ErfK/SrfK
VLELAGFMLLRFLLSLLLLAVFAAGAAEAGLMVVAEAEPDLGGGFLEMLLTGGESQADPGPLRRSAAPGAQYASADPGALEPQAQIDPAFRRAEVDYSGAAPGTIVIDTSERYLYLVQSGGRAIRYGIGVGRPGFEWSGVKAVTRKAAWPDWTLPPQMLRRRPDLPRFMRGGPDNPLGARALYLGSSLYRIHGTNEPETIGQNVSSGCIRMMNEDVADLYDRVRVGARVIVQ